MHANVSSRKRKPSLSLSLAVYVQVKVCAKSSSAKFFWIKYSVTLTSVKIKDFNVTINAIFHAQYKFFCTKNFIILLSMIKELNLSCM